MRLNILGDIRDLEEGINLLRNDLGFILDEAGISVKVEKRPGRIEVGMEGACGYIKYEEKIHFFRALGLFVEEMLQRDRFNIAEEPQFTTNGVMVDVSRNAVLTVDSVKYLLKKMALMGLNVMMLYAEDTYEIKSRPYFGYMRGRYTQGELKECDKFAEMFGIEIIPCIQTLAHLYAALKWNYAKDIKDTADILLAGNDKTYEFIEEMIQAASAPFRSKRIHIGMDEAHGLGLGRYLEINGFRRRFDIMNEHLAKVKEIAYKHTLKPMIWSDMYFRLGSKTGDYYDKNTSIPEDVVNSIPKDTQLVYWDYYHNNEDEYRYFIKAHKLLGCDMIFAGGIWTWNGIVVNYKKSFVTTNAGLGACKKEGIREVFATLWGDNGAETNIMSALLGLQLYAEHGYAQKLNEEKLKKRFETCTGGDFSSFMDLTYMDDVPRTEENERQHSPSNPSKFLLWQDILIGLFDRHVEDKGLSKHYSLLEKKLSKSAEESGNLRIVFDMPAALASVLSLKAEMGIRIKQGYDKKDREALHRIAAEELLELSRRVGRLREAHREQWFTTYKPFGWEVIDMRYGGLIARIETAMFRLSQYSKGEVEKIEELEEERLYFDGPERPEGIVYGRCNAYHRIVSASPLGFNN